MEEPEKAAQLTTNQQSSQAFTQSAENFVSSLKAEEKKNIIINETKNFLKKYKPVEKNDVQYFKKRLNEHLKAGSKFILRRVSPEIVKKN